MSRDSSPPPSDDSAVGSMSSCVANNDKPSSSSEVPIDNNQAPDSRIPTTSSQPEPVFVQNESSYDQSAIPVARNYSKLEQNQTTNEQESGDLQEQSKYQNPAIVGPRKKKNSVNSQDLEEAAKFMKNTNVTLISRSIRTTFSCFDDIDIHKFESTSDYLVEFISNGINNSYSSIRRPVSILWPDNYEKMCSHLAVLDAFLLNTSFRQKPIDWMINRKLTVIPDCRQCKEPMVLRYDNNTVRWQCQRTQACVNYLMPILRPSFFMGYDNVGLDKLLFSVYFWSICTPGDELYKQMNIEPKILDGIWSRMQNVCRVALEKSYPRHRLTNKVESTNDLTKPIDLISVKFNDLFIVCAKNPASNLVRLGLHVPEFTSHSFSQLTENWFAHGTHIRTCEAKFLDLQKRRTDLYVELVPRSQMIAPQGRFCRDSAFGYLICQLSHVFKDFNSSAVSKERIKLILAEIQWRELYGTTPCDAFSNIVLHMAQYGDSADWNSDPSLPVKGEETATNRDYNLSLCNIDYVWAEKYFYATIDPISGDGNIICNFNEQPNLTGAPVPDARFTCHECNENFDSFKFTMHIITHVESNRKEHERKEYLKRGLIECKHCFKTLRREHIGYHSSLFSTHFQMIQYGCRICCTKLDNRAEYLQHMRRMHFEHETPYRCPTCPFASSFQRDVIIHFEEEHRHRIIVLCPLCLRSFTAAKPETITLEKMKELSRIVYNHIAEHYVISKEYSCQNCCLCFLEKESLRKHRQLHHDPLEIRNLNKVKVEPFIVTNEEEKYCVKAIPMELFLANKRPNLMYEGESKELLKLRERYRKRKRSHLIDHERSKHDTSSDDEPINQPATSSRQTPSRPYDSTSKRKPNTSDSSSDSSITDSDSDSSYCMTLAEDGTIHVRGLYDGAQELLKGGEAKMKVVRNPSQVYINPSEIECSPQRLIGYLAKLKRVDGVLPNRSVILTPKSKPSKCVECLDFVTVDHFVSLIRCTNNKCRYRTHCPRAAMRHKNTKHNDGANAAN